MEPTQSTTQRPRLERLRSDRAVAGVASGLARYLGIDVAWVRIGFVLAAIFGGMGVLMYLVGWVAMPEEGEHESIAADKARDFHGSGSWVGLGLIILAGIIIVGNTGIVDGELVFAAVLVGFGVLLYRGDVGKSRESDTLGDQYETTLPYQSEPYDTAAPIVETAEADPFVSGRTSVEPVYPPLDPDPAFQPKPREPRQSSPLGRFAVATLLIVIGVIGVGQSSGWLEPSLRDYAAVVFVVLGTALVVSSFFGRARWLIVLGLLLTPLLLGVALLRVPLEGGFGDPRYIPQSASDLSAEYRLIGGEMILDLTSIDLADGEVVEVDASVVFGRLEVIIPSDLGVEVTSKLDVGEMRVDGVVDNSHVNVSRTIAYEGSGQVALEAHVGFGELVIHEIEEATP